MMMEVNDMITLKTRSLTILFDSTLYDDWYNFLVNVVLPLSTIEEEQLLLYHGP